MIDRASVMEWNEFVPWPDFLYGSFILINLKYILSAVEMW